MNDNCLFCRMSSGEVPVDKVFEDKASVTVKKVNGKPFKKADIRQGDKVANVF